MKKIKIKGTLKAVETKYVSKYAGFPKSSIKRRFSPKQLDWMYYFYVYIYDKNCQNCKYYVSGICISWDMRVSRGFNCSRFKIKK
jgi:hypothetical protein